MFKLTAVFSALLVLLSGCLTGPARIQQQDIGVAVFSCSTREACEVFARAPDRRWNVFYLKDSAWKPSRTEPPEKQNPLRIVFREREETWGIFDNRLYRYLATPWGRVWESIDTCLEGRIVDAYFLSKQAWVLSDQGEIGISTDGGIKWKPYKLGLEGSLSTLYFMDNSNGWMLLNDRTLLTTHDGGLNWNRIADAFKQARVTQLHFDDLNYGWAVAQKYKSPPFTIDGGRTWSTPENNSGDLESIYFFDETNGWALHRGIGIVHTSDGGKTWVQQDIEYPWSYNNPIHYIYEVPLGIAVGVVLIAEFIVVFPFAYIISKFAKPSSPCQNEK